MFSVVRYCVQPYERRGAGLVRGEPQQFRGEGEAIGFAQRIQRRVAGAAVYEVTGWPVHDLWGKPKLIARFGDAPTAEVWRS